VPVIETGAGNCHVYIDKFANMQMAIDITFNSKTQKVSTCNTIDYLLIHKEVAEEMLPEICKKLMEKNVEIRGDEKVM
jgi:glutamate-5-semialdehyde dehydrogenase